MCSIAILTFALALGAPAKSDAVSSETIKPETTIRNLYGALEESLSALRTGPPERRAVYVARMERLMSEELRGKWVADKDYSDKTGCAGHVDRDPFICAQDVEEGMFDTIKYSLIEANAATARVRVTLRNFGAHTIIYVLYKRGDRWVIGDVVSDGESLLGLLSQPYAQGTCSEENP